ncbi:MAG: hypothetical protein Q4C05_06535 [Akkermansia sp.]|nr:hypothetical protein [Akkermansia sp.]
MKQSKTLSIEEKRIWLAEVFRDPHGEYTQADKFKALVEDTKLALIQQEAEQASKIEESPSNEANSFASLIRQIPPADITPADSR